MRGVTRLCGPAANYSCTGAGYAGKSEGWPGALYGRGYASVNRYGLHNCTLYAAYRLWKNGLSNPGWHGNATLWDTRAPSSRVDQSPALGAIAQWNRNYGHVAYVEKVTSSYIEITDDNYGLNSTDRFRIARSSSAMPDNFIHLKDLSQKPKSPTSKPPTKPSSTATPASKGDSTGFYDPGPAGWHLSNALAPGSSDYIFSRGSAGTIPVVGDWNGDGKDSTGFYDPGPAGWHLSNSLSDGPSDYIFSKGPPNKIPVVGDWDGDGKDSVGYYDSGPAGWHLSNSLAPGSSDYIFARGAANVIPVVGDWDGDGKDSTGYYDPTDQSWHLRNELSPGPSEYAFVRGAPGTIPVVGDWDGDGKASTGYYDPGPGGWHLRNALSDGSSDYIFARGNPNVIPVVGNWDGR